MQGSGKTAICDGYFVPNKHVDTTALPVQVFHPVFQQFLDRINDPTFTPDIATIAAVSELMTQTMVLQKSELDASQILRALVTDILGKDVAQVASRGSRMPDGLVSKRVGHCRIPLVCVEYKRALGEGGCDPSVQAAYSIREFLVLKSVGDFPTFLRPD